MKFSSSSLHVGFISIGYHICKAEMNIIVKGVKTMQRRVLFLLFIGLVLIFTVGYVPFSTRMKTQETDAPVDPANFVKKIDNKYFPLKPGTTFFYKGVAKEGDVRSEFFVTDDTKVILGVKTTVVRDTVKVNGELTEKTFDWFAQDKQGNVWYFGEDSKEYKNGKVVSTEGSWQAGVDGAKPGIIMEANPQVGDSYQQELAKGVAEDMAQVLNLGKSVSVPFGSFDNCLQTKEWTPLEPGVVEHKYYAPKIGLVLVIQVKGPKERVELVNITSEENDK